MYDPKTKKITYMDLCFHAHHLMFAEDANNTLWFNDLGMGHSIMGWLNTKMWDETHDAAEVAGVDRPDSRHERQRQARRVRRPERSRRSDEGQAD